MEDPYHVIRDPEDRRVFLSGLSRFSETFCRLMGNDGTFTMRFEVRVTGGRVAHARLQSDQFDLPQNTQRVKRDWPGNG